MKVSVIVPFLDEEPYIEQCIEALEAQDFDRDEYELIFVDSGSQDRSVEIVRQYSNVSLFQVTKANPYTARNCGLKSAKGDIIAFTDADCAPSSNWLKRLCAGMTDTKAGILLGRRCFCPESSLSLRFFEQYENAKVKYIYEKCGTEYYFGFTNNMAVRAELFRTLGEFLEWEVTGDLEFVHRYVSKTPNAEVLYRDEMKVTHLEVETLWTWLSKIYSYGQHCARVQEVRDYRPLGLGDKINVFRGCLNENDHALWQKTVFLLVLLLGEASFQLGSALKIALKREAFDGESSG